MSLFDAFLRKSIFSDNSLFWCKPSIMIFGQMSPYPFKVDKNFHVL